MKWSLPENLVWKVPVPGKGHASPIILGDRVYLVTAMEEEQTRDLICLDRATGKKLWSKVVLKSPFEGVHRLNSRASSTPSSDGERIYLSFLDRDKMFVAAYDLDGKKLWEVPRESSRASTGIAHLGSLKDKVIVNGDHDGPGYLVALDKKTGKTIWKTARPNNTRSYCTPLIRTIGGRNQLILSGSLCVASYDPDTGKQHWISDGPTEQYVASLVYNGDLLFMTCGFPKRFMQAIRPDGSGNVTKTHVVWETTKGCSYVPSPVAIGPYFVVVADNGVASCFVAKTGERLWMERLKGGHSASLLKANGLVYFLSDRGIMSVVKPGPEFKVVAENEVGVLRNPRLFGRTAFRAWCAAPLLHQGLKAGPVLLREHLSFYGFPVIESVDYSGGSALAGGMIMGPYPILLVLFVDALHGLVGGVEPSRVGPVEISLFVGRIELPGSPPVPFGVRAVKLAV